VCDESTIARLICSAGAAPPAGGGNAISVLTAMRFQLVTSLIDEAVWARAGTAAPQAISIAVAVANRAIGSSQ
jgi:hypothetical protein